MFTLAVLLAGAVQADAWITTTHHDGDVPLYRGAHKSFSNGNELWLQCNSGAQSDGYALCAAYIVGVADVFQAQNGNNICVPPDAIVGQVADVVTKYLREHPELRHCSSQSLIWVALTDAFPCKGS